ncbi:MAG: YjbQ family protein [Deltaproteobacteria bacterium]|jgi:secondary thiamine-phosphate synthase enzyme|nr:YjbQ family protein [Deltaproteobacteria bacterium]MBW2511404.1 YjbQ family protein [Deltaproteobacteria bacterium]MDH4007168.1 secondary thiamine-phosphate synthase enzyme YjbQ [Desulfuromonadales bacterium]
MRTLTVKSHKQVELIDITDDVIKTILEDNITEGLAVIYTPHTTAAITINENADPDVSRDIIMGTDKLIPLRDDYRHLEGNSAAHIKSSLFGASETLIINNGTPVLGTWQGIYFCEFDGPRQRHVHIQTVGA